MGQAAWRAQPSQQTVLPSPIGLEFPSLHHNFSSQEALTALANTGLFGFCLPTILSTCGPSSAAHLPLELGTCGFLSLLCLGGHRHYRIHKNLNSKSPPCFPRWLTLDELVPQLPNYKTKEICGNSKCHAVFPHPGSGKEGTGPRKSIFRPSSKGMRGKESGPGRCKSLQKREKEGAFPRAGGQNG